jgi:hypothetical protein
LAVQSHHISRHISQILRSITPHNHVFTYLALFKITILNRSKTNTLYIQIIGQSNHIIPEDMFQKLSDQSYHRFSNNHVSPYLILSQAAIPNNSRTKILYIQAIRWFNYITSEYPFHEFSYQSHHTYSNIHKPQS